VESVVLQQIPVTFHDGNGWRTETHTLEWVAALICRRCPELSGIEDRNHRKIGEAFVYSPGKDSRLWTSDPQAWVALKWRRPRLTAAQVRDLDPMFQHPEITLERGLDGNVYGRPPPQVNEPMPVSELRGESRLTWDEMVANPDWHLDPDNFEPFRWLCKRCRRIHDDPPADLEELSRRMLDSKTKRLGYLFV
jgi:hypothetical protein